jgi:hypothetical protein
VESDASAAASWLALAVCAAGSIAASWCVETGAESAVGNSGSLNTTVAADMLVCEVSGNAIVSAMRTASNSIEHLGMVSSKDTSKLRWWIGLNFRRRATKSGFLTESSTRFGMTSWFGHLTSRERFCRDDAGSRRGKKRAKFVVLDAMMAANPVPTLSRGRTLKPWRSLPRNLRPA